MKRLITQVLGCRVNSKIPHPKNKTSLGPLIWYSCKCFMTSIQGIAGKEDGT
jgi:hypothetical protein